MTFLSGVFMSGLELFFNFNMPVMGWVLLVAAAALAGDAAGGGSSARVPNPGSLSPIQPMSEIKTWGSRALSKRDDAWGVVCAVQGVLGGGSSHCRNESPKLAAPFSSLHLSWWVFCRKTFCIFENRVKIVVEKSTVGGWWDSGGTNLPCKNSSDENSDENSGEGLS